MLFSSHASVSQSVSRSVGRSVGWLVGRNRVWLLFFCLLGQNRSVGSSMDMDLDMDIGIDEGGMVYQEPG